MLSYVATTSSNTYATGTWMCCIFHVPYRVRLGSCTIRVGLFLARKCREGVTDGNTRTATPAYVSSACPLWEIRARHDAEKEIIPVPLLMW